ncbi:MAG: hypothetical protein WAQ57_00255 [Candidatus Saccharimonadales bacterium]
MAERAPHSPEQSYELGHEHSKRAHEALQAKHEQASRTRHEHAERLDDIRKEAEAAATSAHETHKKHQAEQAPAENESSLPINRELKDMAYRRTLKRTQRQLPPVSRTFSKVIHQPAVEAVSDLADHTVARPSGILAGGIAAFLGSSLFLWVTRHYGYEYNFLLFALFFVGGFFVGLLVELGLRFGVRRQR